MGAYPVDEEVGDGVGEDVVDEGRDGVEVGPLGDFGEEAEVGALVGLVVLPACDEKGGACVASGAEGADGDAGVGEGV